MSDRVGLCARCACVRVVESGRGSRFYLCQRSRNDPAYPRYPRLPVLRCPGFVEVAEEDRGPPPTADG